MLITSLTHRNYFCPQLHASSMFILLHKHRVKLLHATLSHYSVLRLRRRQLLRAAAHLPGPRASFLFHGIISLELALKRKTTESKALDNLLELFVIYTVLLLLLFLIPVPLVHFWALLPRLRILDTDSLLPSVLWIQKNTLGSSGWECWALEALPSDELQPGRDPSQEPR